MQKHPQWRDLRKARSGVVRNEWIVHYKTLKIFPYKYNVKKLKSKQQTYLKFSVSRPVS